MLPLVSQFEYTPFSCRLFLAIVCKCDVIHETGSVLSSEEEQATATGSMY